MGWGLLSIMVVSSRSSTKHTMSDTIRAEPWIEMHSVTILTPKQTTRTFARWAMTAVLVLATTDVVAAAGGSEVEVVPLPVPAASPDESPEAPAHESEQEPALPPTPGTQFLWADFSQWLDTPALNGPPLTAIPSLQLPDDEAAVDRTAAPPPDATLRFEDALNNEWSFGSWQLSQSLRFHADDVAASPQTIPTGVLDLAPSLGELRLRDDGTVIEPLVSVGGSWDFEPFLGALDEAALSGFNAHVKGGVRVEEIGNWSLDASTSVGSGTEPGRSLELRGNIGVSVPLN